jgi:hypothetical protein
VVRYRTSEEYQQEMEAMQSMVEVMRGSARERYLAMKAERVGLFRKGRIRPSRLDKAKLRKEIQEINARPEELNERMVSVIVKGN